ncbi:MAG: hypothetical protein LJD31_00855 [Wolbachia endosymbiont of Menacanthus eurysternus]|nr:hypothetical protein [Wolbachia endosymbiont of Menacanthus eurysternus]
MSSTGMTRRGATGVTRREYWNDGRRKHWNDRRRNYLKHPAANSKQCLYNFHGARNSRTFRRKRGRLSLPLCFV